MRVEVDQEKVVAIIQARTSSRRLPGKIFEDISGRPLIERVIERVRLSESVDQIVVATSIESTDDRLEEHCSDRCIPLYRGSLEDVLARFRECAIRWKADIIVRITADDPLKDPGLVDEAVGMCIKDKTLDYVSNTLSFTYPEGVDVEVFRRRALEKAHNEAVLASEREHVTPYIWKNLGLFRVAELVSRKNYSHQRWTIDDQNDLEMIRMIFKIYGKKVETAHWEDIARWLDKREDILQINSATPRNEGYNRSVNQERSGSWH